MQNQIISELYTNETKTKYSSNPSDTPKSAKNFYEKLYIKRESLKVQLLNFLNKISHGKKVSNEQFHLLRLKCL